MIKSEALDQRYMSIALALGRRGLGRVWPNPSVGCVIVQGNSIVGRGWTQSGGRPHAETQALERSGLKAKGSCAYVTLEPCSHHGETRPCVDALISAGISKCVIATEDLDPRVSGSGVAKLREAGIEVKLGVLSDLAKEQNEGFFLRMGTGRPLVTLKVATSLDGCIATGQGESQWITGSKARFRAHQMRAEYDAIMIGIGTAIGDNPMLTCRIPGMEHFSPVRIILDSNMRLPLTHSLAESATEYPTWIITKRGWGNDRIASFIECGLKVIEVDSGDEDNLPVENVLRSLGSRGITRLLIEGGQAIASSFLKAGAVNRVAWFRAPFIIGGDGMSVTNALGLSSLSKAIKLQNTSREFLDDDVLETFSIEVTD